MSFATEEVGKTCDTFIKTANGLLGKRVANFSPWSSFFLYTSKVMILQTEEFLTIVCRFMVIAVLHSYNKILLRGVLLKN